MPLVALIFDVEFVIRPKIGHIIFVVLHAKLISLPWLKVLCHLLLNNMAGAESLSYRTLLLLYKFVWFYFANQGINSLSIYILFIYCIYYKLRMSISKSEAWDKCVLTTCPGFLHRIHSECSLDYIASALLLRSPCHTICY